MLALLPSYNSPHHYNHIILQLTTLTYDTRKFGFVHGPNRNIFDHAYGFNAIDDVPKYDMFVI